MFFTKRIKFDVVLNHRDTERVTRRFTLLVGPFGASVTVVPEGKPPVSIATNAGTVTLNMPIAMRLEDREP